MAACSMRVLFLKANHSSRRPERPLSAAIVGNGRSINECCSLWRIWTSVQHRPENMVPKGRAHAVVSGRKSVVNLVMLEQW